MTGDGIGSLAIAALGGAVVGLERQWSGHAEGPRARFGGIRTFTLLGLLGGIAGQVLSGGAPMLAAALAAGGAALVVAAYVAASRSDIDGTTEAAALVVLAAGVLAGSGHTVLASGLAATTGLLLVEKSRLHTMVERIDGDDLRAGIRFAAMAVVVLPLVPPGPFGPGLGVRPRELWMLVLFFSGLSFAGHVARKALGDQHGLTAAGAIGGLVSSTNVTLTFARASRDEAALARPLALGAVAANLVLFPRVLIATAVLNPPLARVLWPWLLPPLAVAAATTVWGLRRSAPSAHTPAVTTNPLRVGAALHMAILFQLVLYGVDAAQTWFGNAGLFASAAALGMTDVDALTVTMARATAARAGLDTAARAIAVGVLANTVLKAAIALVVGRGSFRRVTGAALVAMAAALAVALLRW